MSEHLGKITEDLAEDITQNIEQSRTVTSTVEGNYSTPAPLSAKYRAYKLKKLGYTNIFHGFTGKLRKAVETQKVNDLKHKILVNDKVEYAQYLNDGTDKMKARKFFGLSKKIISDVEKEFKGLTIG